MNVKMSMDMRGCIIFVDVFLIPMVFQAEKNSCEKFAAFVWNGTITGNVRGTAAENRTTGLNERESSRDARLDQRERGARRASACFFCQSLPKQLMKITKNTFSTM